MFSSLAVTVGLLVAYHSMASSPYRWASLVLLPIAGVCWLRWVRFKARRKARRAVGARLTRLPDDFMILYDVVVPSPWGRTHMDQVILSRFGVVVASVGPPDGWVGGQVEAVRTLLFHQGLMRPPFPLAPLILLPPGSAERRRVHNGVLMVRVEQLRLEHLAPSRTPVLSAAQIQAIAQCLVHPEAQTA